jgi:Ion channel
MHIFAALGGLVLLFVVLWDAFETVILPRRVMREYRLARLFFRTTWLLWRAIARKISSKKVQQSFLSYYGPLSLLLIFGVWAAALILAFGMLQWAAGPRVAGAAATFRSDIYLSGSTFFTLGMGDVTPKTTVARVVAVFEAGTGFGVLAIVISYLPTMYGAFSQREVNISLLDARAGSPPTAGELLRRHGRQRIEDGLSIYLRDWETWSAQLMESHLTYPFLCFFRSQHDNQSWVAAFTAILDVCALLIAYGDGEVKWQAQLTFAISRHAVADLSQVLRLRPRESAPNRLAHDDLPKVRALLIACGVPGCTDAGDVKLKELRSMYEPYLDVLSKLLLMPLPSWGADVAPNRDTTIWGRITSAMPGGRSAQADIDHF